MAAKTHEQRKYRPDIDGLRAIAVLLVVLNHLEFRRARGGYVGVDVFFVISGYLIGSSLLSEFSRGTFSLLGFYERRIRRIFPALFVMLIIVTALAYHYLLPMALVSYAKSLLAAVLSGSNFLFSQQAGYFDTSSVTNPLLHTWSLGVEEQFYVFFPILLYMIFRWFPQRPRTILWVVAMLSFAATVWIVRFDSPAAFFWSPLRAWELVTGALISQYKLIGFRKRWAREVATLAGLLLILYCCLFYSSETLFPGWTAILPCAGAALIIGVGQVGTSAVGRMLSTRPFTFLGLISYSLYLWHWPVVVFQSRGWSISNPPFERNTKLILLSVSIVLGTLSWWFVERPFRPGGGRLRLRQTPLFVLSGTFAGIVACTGLWMVHSMGQPSRFPMKVDQVESFENYDISHAWRQGTCFLEISNSMEDFKPETCLDRAPNRMQYLLLGDSMAAQIYAALVKTFPAIHFQQATASACQPESPVAVPQKNEPNCEALWRYIQMDYLPTHHPDAVILGGMWVEWSVNGLDKEIRIFQEHGIPVILLGPPISYDLPLPLILTTEMRRQESGSMLVRSVTKHLLINESFDHALSKMAHDKWHIRYISYFKDLCGNQIEMQAKAQLETTNGCPVLTSGGDPMLFDEHHFTLPGSLMFARLTRDLKQLP